MIEVIILISNVDTCKTRWRSSH